MEANGHPQTDGHAATLAEQLREARDRAELAHLRAEARLLEMLCPAGFGDYGEWWPDRFGTTGGSRDWLPTPSNRTDRADGGNRPFVFSEIDLDWMRSQARWLAGKNSLAQGALRTLTNFAVRKGYAWECRPEKRFEADPTAVSLAGQAQAVLDQFHDLNLWSMRERELFARSRRDGDGLLRHFAQADGTTLVRFVDPEQLRCPEGYPPNWSYGVHTRPDDVETVLSYAVTYDASRPDHWDEVSAEEVSHLKLNVDSCVKRGLSDFYSTAEAFDNTHKLLRSMAITGAVQSAIAWVEEVDNATQAAIDRHVGARADLGRNVVPNPITGRTTQSQRMEPGTVKVVGSGKKYLPGPLAANTTQHISIVQACLRAVGARWNMPEFMISADASNANYSSTLVAGSPFVTSIECEQEVYGLFFLRSQWIALKNACAAGLVRLPDGRACPFETLQAYVDVHYTPPQVAIADVLEEARVDHLDIAAGVMSLQTRRNRRDLDTDQERANMAAEPPTRVTGRVVDIDAAGNPVQGGGGGGAAGGGGLGGTREGRLREDKDELGHGSEKRGGSHPDDEPADPEEARQAWEEYDRDHAEWEKEYDAIKAGHEEEKAAHEKEVAELTATYQKEKAEYDAREANREARQERTEVDHATVAFDATGGLALPPDPSLIGEEGYDADVKEFADRHASAWERAYGEQGNLRSMLDGMGATAAEKARVQAVADRGRAAVERAVGKYQKAALKHARADAAYESHKQRMPPEPVEPDEPEEPDEPGEDATPQEREAYASASRQYEKEMKRYEKDHAAWEKAQIRFEEAEQELADLEGAIDEAADAVSDAIGEVDDAWDEQQGKVGEASEKVAQRLYDEVQAEGEADPEPEEPEMPDEPEEPDYPDEPEPPDVERPTPTPTPQP
jgi:hypothetical protein